MARRVIRGRGRAKRRTATRSTMTDSLSGVLNPTAVPRVLLGTVDGVEAVTVGALHIACDVLVTTVSGVANIGATAVTATAEGTREIVSAASQAVANIVETAQGTVLATVDNVWNSRHGTARSAPRRGGAFMAGGPGEKAPALRSPGASRGRGRAGRLRFVTGRERASVAA